MAVQLFNSREHSRVAAEDIKWKSSLVGVDKTQIHYTKLQGDLLWHGFSPTFNS